MKAGELIHASQSQGVIPTLSIPIWSMLTKRELTKWELTKWEDSPFEILLTTIIDRLCASELLNKCIMKNIHGTLVPACSILSQVLTISS